MDIVKVYYSLLDSIVKSIILLLPDSDKRINIELRGMKDELQYTMFLNDVHSYSLEYGKNFGFYDVVRLKFFKIGELYYLSLDPFDPPGEELKKHPNDSDVFEFLNFKFETSVTPSR